MNYWSSFHDRGEAIAMSDQSKIAPRLIEIVAENTRETISLDAIVSVGMYQALTKEGYYVRVLLGEKLVTVEFFYLSEPQAFKEYVRINDARQAIDAWMKSR
jgi:hypothetical protein